MSSSDAENLLASQTGNAPYLDDGAAVDESDEADSDFVDLQKTISQKKRAARDCNEARLKKVLPVPYSPNIRPLSISDLESVVALENAAFQNPEFRASRDKVPRKRKSPTRIHDADLVY
jgi:hypothetical protein